MGETCNTKGREEKCVQRFGVNMEENRLFGVPRSKQDNIKIHSKETGWEDVEWNHRAEDRD
jgi:hypothetical protein